MKKREIRRDRDYRYGRKTQRIHLRWVHPDGVLDCACENSVWFFTKRKAIGCDCRKRKHGQPKRSTGPCNSYGMMPRQSLVERRKGRKLCKDWMDEVYGL